MDSTGWDDWGSAANHQPVHYKELAPDQDLSRRVSWSRALKQKAMKNFILNKVLDGWQPATNQ